MSLIFCFLAHTFIHTLMLTHCINLDTHSSSVVQSALINAHKKNIKFRVIVVDSRPKMEGKCAVNWYVNCCMLCGYKLLFIRPRSVLALFL